jgi:hypothetical protein
MAVSSSARSSAGIVGSAGLFGVAAWRARAQQLGGGDGGGDIGDVVGVGVVDDDEVLGGGAVDAGEESRFGVGFGFGGEWDAVLVAFVDLGGLVGGDVEAGRRGRGTGRRRRLRGRGRRGRRRA